jgi:general secretion pathway protein D
MQDASQGETVTMGKRYRQSAWQICSVALLVAACSPTAHQPSPDAAGLHSGQPDRTVVQEATPPIQDTAIEPSGTRHARQQIIEIGTGQYTTPGIPRESLRQSTEGNITLNFQGTDIHEFIKAIMGDVLQLNYMIDPKVAGSVTIETTNPVNNQELLPLVEDILAMNGAVLINDHGFYRVLPKAGAIRGHVTPGYQSDAAAGYGVRIIPLTFIAAQEMQKILEPFLPDSSSIRIDPQRNLLILSGTPQELENLQETVDIFDVDWLRGMSVGLYPLDYVDPKTLKSELDAILAGTEGSQGGQLLGGLVRTVAIERLNSILLISATANALRETELWIYRLDRPGEQLGQQLYVYKLDNAKAIEIAEILGHIFGSSVKSVTGRSAPSLAPGTTPVEISSAIGLEGQPPAEPAQGLPPSVSPEVNPALPSHSAIEIIADDVRNAVVVKATPSDYKMVEATIKKLDIVPLQVLIEASIIEVTLADDLNYGVEWFFKNNLHGNKQGSGTLDLGDAGIAALAPSFSYTIVDSASNVRLALNALAAESLINVLSSPSLMVLDNQMAKINVGDEIPVPTRQSVSNIDPNAPTVNEIQFRKTGVTLTVKPRVNSSGLVTMEIKQEVSNAVETTTSTLNAPTIQQREIESVVAINSGETIVLGGLIQDSKTNNESGIPGLYKIPLIGKLFGQTSNLQRRTELLVLLTPRVVRDKNEARDITDEFRRKLKGLPPLEGPHTDPLITDKPS